MIMNSSAGHRAGMWVWPVFFAMNATSILKRPGLGAVPALITWLVWLGVGLSASYWCLLWWGQAPRTQVPTPAEPARMLDPAAVARALGAAEAAGVAAQAVVAPPAVLVGVLGGPKGQGVALLSVEGQAAKPYRVGAEVVGGWRLASVAGRAAVLARGSEAAAPTHRLELPPLK